MNRFGQPQAPAGNAAPLEPHEEILAVVVAARASLGRVDALLREDLDHDALREAYRTRLLVTGVQGDDPTLADLKQATSLAIEEVQGRIDARRPTGWDPASTGAQGATLTRTETHGAAGFLAPWSQVPLRGKILACVLLVLVAALAGPYLRVQWLMRSCRVETGQCLGVAEESLSKARRGVSLKQYRDLMSDSMTPAFTRLQKFLPEEIMRGGRALDLRSLRELVRGLMLMDKALEQWEARAAAGGESGDIVSGDMDTSDATVREIQKNWKDAGEALVASRRAWEAGE